MRKLFPAVLTVAAFAAPLTAQAPEARPTISVSASGKVTARPDLAIVSLSIRSSASLAADALDQNAKKVQEVQAKLAALGYRPDHVRFSGNRFSPPGGGVYYAGRERPTGFDVFNNFYVYLDGQDLRDAAAFNAKVATLLDELSKIGAGPLTGPMPVSMGGSSVVSFALKAPEPYEQQAFQQALDKARPLADEVARRMKVQITGIDGVSSLGMVRGMAGQGTPLDEIPYDYLSPSPDEVPVRISLNVRFAYK